jgi:PleD family two-component response regulator
MEFVICSIRINLYLKDMTIRILVVDDEKGISDLLEYYLQNEGYKV